MKTNREKNAFWIYEGANYCRLKIRLPKWFIDYWVLAS